LNFVFCPFLPPKFDFGLAINAKGGMATPFIQTKAPHKGQMTFDRQSTNPAMLKCCREMVIHS
jgi:hypothetical protein